MSCRFWRRPDRGGAEQGPERRCVLIVLFSVPLIGGLIVFQPLVIRILYNEEFLPSIEMLHWLLLANYFRVAQWLFLLVSTARAQLGIFTVTGVGFNLGFFAHRLACRRLSGRMPARSCGSPAFAGLGFAFFVPYRRPSHGHGRLQTWQRYRYFTDLRTSLVWLVGLAVVVLCAVMTWNDFR